MKHRYFVLMTALAIAIAVMSLAPVSVEGQGPTAAAKRWTPPRTPDGQPDLQGIWSFATITPLERPSELAGKQVLTDDEAAELQEQAAQSRIDRAPREGDPGTYNQFWFDRGTKVVATKRTSLIVDPPDGRIPPLTPEAQQREAARAAVLRGRPSSYEDRGLSERCIVRPWSGPPITPGNYNNNVQLFQAPGYVVIFLEQNHDARIVALDGRPHLGQRIRQFLGNSRGRWEGNTLVVDTTNFTDHVGKSNFRGSGGNMHLVERFTRTDADTLNYEFTVDDPTSFTKPWTAVLPMTKSQGEIYEYACHEGNYTIANILHAARAEDRAAAEEVKTESR